ncbi:hypothetical protein [Pedobacter jeongneungensis]|uniref:hypothetical protein n=1 Tax=Pedobacter jeongneungensis TaxID=947309 RepID=UPI00046817AA|nr:hypothetical protein [Pedobacter jeongneungensis]
MNNIKRLFLGIAAIALTLSFSAFKETKAEKASKFATVNYGWNVLNQRYEKITGTPNPTGLCDAVATQECVVQIDSPNPTPPLNITEQEAQDAGATKYPGSSAGSYFN